MSARIVLVGGHGGMLDRYREAVAPLELVHFETKIPNGTRRLEGVAALLVVTTRISHTLLERARTLVPERTPIVYLRTASASSLRGAAAKIVDGGGLASRSASA